MPTRDHETINATDTVVAASTRNDQRLNGIDPHHALGVEFLADGARAQVGASRWRSPRLSPTRSPAARSG